MCALCIFVYQTLDNLDGKQARRTGSSSALGEAFDHGGDSLTTMLFSILGTVFQFGPVLTFIFQILLILVFFFCHWEAYFTGVLILRPLDNPTEAQCTLMLLMLITMIAGPLFWLTEVNILFVGPVQLNQILFFIYVIGSLNTCLDNISKVNDHFTNLQMKKTGPLLCLLPLGVMLTLSVMSAWFSPTLLLDHPRLFLGSVGLMFSYLQIRLIIQNVCKEPFKPFYNVLIPLFLFTFNCFLEVRGDPIMDTGFLVKAYFFYCLVLVCYLIYSVVNELTTILNIRAFVINPVPISRV
jgi:ethanolaminephosphotransferase